MNTYPLTISTPDGNRFRGDAVFLSLRGVEGDLAILAGHVPFVTSVAECDVCVELQDGTEKIGHTDGGLLTVAPEGVTLLSGDFCWNES